MIIHQITFASDDTFYRCDHLPCSKVGAGRKDNTADGKGMVRPPIGWIVPQRSREMANPGVTPEVFCSVACLNAHDGCPPDSAEELPEPAPDVVRVTSIKEALSGRP